MIRIFVGEDIENVTFNHRKGGVSVSYGLNEFLFLDGSHHSIAFPEAKRHPVKLTGILLNFIKNSHCSAHDYIIVTHSKDIINILGDWVRDQDNDLKHDEIEIYLVNSDCKEYDICGFSHDGYVTGPWIPGFLSY